MLPVQLPSDPFALLGVVVGLAVVAVALAGISTYISWALVRRRAIRSTEKVVAAARQSLDDLQRGLASARGGQIATIVRDLRKGGAESATKDDLANAVWVLGEHEIALREQELLLARANLEGRLAAQRAEVSLLAPLLIGIAQNAFFFGLSVAITFLITAMYAMSTQSTHH